MLAGDRTGEPRCSTRRSSWPGTGEPEKFGRHGNRKDQRRSPPQVLRTIQEYKQAVEQLEAQAKKLEAGLHGAPRLFRKGRTRRRCAWPA